MGVAQELHPYRPLVEQALAGGSVTYEELQAHIEAGRLFLLSNDGAVLVYERVALGDGTWMLCIFVVAGDMEHARPLIDEAERIATTQGAVKISAIGRWGWALEARRRGYETMVYMKELRR